MKKTIFLLAAAVGMALLAACEKTPPVEPIPGPGPDDPGTREEIALADTYWAAETVWGDTHELTFTETEATYVFKAHTGYRWVATGKYSYRHPTITIESDDWLGYPLATLTGTVDGDDMMTLELVPATRTEPGAITLKKQSPPSVVPPERPSVYGEWGLVAGATTRDGVRREWKSDGIPIYSFLRDYTGWVYRNNDFQESFNWDRRGGISNLQVFGWRLRLSDYIIVDPSGFIMDEEWNILELTTDRLVVSHLMIPDPHWFGEMPEMKPYTVEMGFERIR